MKCFASWFIFCNNFLGMMYLKAYVFFKFSGSSKIALNIAITPFDVLNFYSALWMNADINLKSIAHNLRISKKNYLQKFTMD